MAEVWEQYLRNRLSRELAKYGWQLFDNILSTYEETFFTRKIIPDLIFKKGNNLAVWDAKYKRMTGQKIDLDREDFFQIHTYIQYFLLNKVQPYNVICGGLFYPLSDNKLVDDNSSGFVGYTSDNLLTSEGPKTKFVVDGIKVWDGMGKAEFENETGEFLKRIKSYLGITPSP
jgi:hypothetical protein